MSKDQSKTDGKSRILSDQQKGGKNKALEKQNKQDVGATTGAVRQSQRTILQLPKTSKSKSRKNSESCPSSAVDSSNGSAKEQNQVIDSYEIHGFSGMQRDIILRLIGMIWFHSKKIRSIVGMCKSHYIWKKHFYFLNGRPKTLSVSFHPKPSKNCMIRPVMNGIQVLFNHGCCDSNIFLNKTISHGVYRWTIKICYGESEETPDIWIGVAPKECLDRRIAIGDPDYEIDGGYFDGSCSIRTWAAKYDHSCGCCLSSVGNDMSRVGHEVKIPEYKWGIPDGSVVSAEVDATARTLSFYVGKERIPHVITDIITPLRLGMCSCNNADFTSLLFRRLPAPTPCSVPCTYYKCKKSEEIKDNK